MGNDLFLQDSLLRKWFGVFCEERRKAAGVRARRASF
jgi:hypothetical protein